MKKAHQVPLLGRVGKPHSTALRCSYTMVNQFYSGILLIIESPGKKITVHKQVHTLRFEILKLIEFQILARNKIECCHQLHCNQ